MKHTRRRVAWAGGMVGIGLCLIFALPVQAAEHPVLPLLQQELERAQEGLVGPDGTKPYFIQYAVTDSKAVSVSATLGAVVAEVDTTRRVLDVDVRCGDYELDSTRQIRGQGFFGRGMFGGRATTLPLDGDPIATRHALWLATDNAFKEAVERLARVKANLKVKVEEEDPANDFSREEPNVSIGPWVVQSCDLPGWSERVKALSARFREHPNIYSSGVSLSGEVENKLIVNTEGTRLQFGRGTWRVGIRASTIAEDGMELWLYDSFDAHSPDGLPDQKMMLEAVDRLASQVLALREAPIVEPYMGPAILRNRAAGVFFHEIFGHRIEGHRQKDEEEGQTFAKKIGKEVLPEFLSVVDDPSKRTFGDIDLNGFYAFDDEGVAGQPARLVEEGVLKTFLLSRSPTRGFTKSNGHGRRAPGNQVVSRQGNLVVQSEKQVPFDELRQKLIEECKKQDKEFGLLFEDISGGFTTTQRRGPQAFKVIPLVVYRVYTDGRPDELVRGVDIVGTPLTSFSKIVYTGNDPGVFNGTCGAESGSVPVSAISPSLLIEQIEVEKKQKAQDRPPILPAPIAESK
jgi:TldD protein